MKSLQVVRFRGLLSQPIVKKNEKNIRQSSPRNHGAEKVNGNHHLETICIAFALEV